MKFIELLSPARDAECGIEAIRCGADAVYIGARHFGARAEATNSSEDIEKLVRYAHIYGAKVYVTLNTILYNHEIEPARKLALELAEIGVDALITQDAAFIQMGLPIPIHASTQMDNRSIEQITFLQECGIPRAVLARELSIQEISNIHKACPKMELEVFVHGALCTSLSGKCYASQYCFQRSANRGECAQFCRLPFDLEDANGNVIIGDKHLLSLKDMNRSHSLEELMDAGACSFKIEGRLKSKEYVKNITSYYRQEIDKILKRKEGFSRSSFGTSHNSFVPSPQKSFNRGFTEYFLHGRSKDICSFHTPKSIGEPVGEVKDIRGNRIRVSSLETFHNGDGFCFFDKQKKLQGFRINKAENNILFPDAIPQNLSHHTLLYRNYDHDFLNALGKESPERTLSLKMELQETEDGFLLKLQDETGKSISQNFEFSKETARTPQEERQKHELSKLGGTPFHAEEIIIQNQQNYFIPASALSNWRRQCITELLKQHQETPENESPLPPTYHPYPQKELDRYANVSNRLAEEFYQQHGVEKIDKAFELGNPQNALLMTCKHCLRHALGCCKKETRQKEDFKEPLFLTLQNGKRFRLEFNCPHCQMLVYATS